MLSFTVSDEESRETTRLCSRYRWSGYQQTSVLCEYRLEEIRTPASLASFSTANRKCLLYRQPVCFLNSRVCYGPKSCRVAY